MPQLSTPNTISVTMDNGKITSVNINLPRTWHELTTDQLHYILQLQAYSTMSPAEIRTCAFLRFAGLEEIPPRDETQRRLKEEGWHHYRTPKGSEAKTIMLAEWQVREAVVSLAWLDHPTADVVCLTDAVKKYHPYQADLSDLPYGEWLTIEAIWQQALLWGQQAREAMESAFNDGLPVEAVHEAREKADELIDRIAHILYISDRHPLRISIPLTDRSVTIGRESKPFASSPLIRQAVEHWMTGWHIFSIEQWPHLFRSNAEGQSEITSDVLREQIDNQVNALTGGDVTRTDAVMHLDTWTALNALDRKAREAAAAEARINNQ